MQLISITQFFVLVLAAGLPIAQGAPVEATSDLEVRHHKGFGAAGKLILPFSLCLMRRHQDSLMRIALFGQVEIGGLVITPRP